MSKSISIDTVSALQAAEQVIWTLEPITCDQCEDVCYSIEGIASGKLGNDFWRTPVSWAAHLRLPVALSLLGAQIQRMGGRARARELAQQLQEVHPTLW